MIETHADTHQSLAETSKYIITMYVRNDVHFFSISRHQIRSKTICSFECTASYFNTVTNNTIVVKKRYVFDIPN